MERGKALLSVQALRALAAASVVIHHVLNMLTHNAGYSFAPIGNWSAGVDLFFLISGFVMIYTHAGDFGGRGAAVSFARRRLIRIVPLYWIVTTAVVILLVILPRAFSSIKLDWPNVICSYFFVLSPNSQGDIGTVTQTGWTLCFEAYFYLVFAVLLLLPRRYFLPVAGVIFVAGVAIGSSNISIAPWATVAVRPLVLEFYLGTAVGLLFLRGYAFSALGAAIAILIGVGAISLVQGTDDWTRVLYWGVGSGLILAGAVSLERFNLRVPKVLVALGASSYSLYLVHPLIMPALGKAWAAAGLSGVPAVVPGAIAFAASLLVAHGIYLFLEKPMTEWLKGTSATSIKPKGATAQ